MRSTHSVKKRIYFFGVIILLIAATITLGSCFGHMHHAKNMHEDLVEFQLFKITKELDLNESQQNFLKETINELKQKKETLHKDKDNHIKKLKKLINSDYITKDQLEPLIEEKQEKAELIKEFIIDKIIEFHSTLTDDQKMKAIKLIDKYTEFFDK